MLDPSFYPQRPSEVTHLETHISHIFLAGDLVYKIKKAVRFSFLDYSTPARRKHFLQEELRLNRRLAPSVYLGILPVSHDGCGWQLGSNLRPVEHVLLMRRLPAKRMLDYLLERDQVAPQMMGALAQLLAAFHAEAPSGQKIRAYGRPEVIRKVWDGNLADIRPFVGRLLTAETFEVVRAFGERFMTEHRDLMLRRSDEGRIREVHGDLHCEHICFAPEGIQIFDCVEFSLRLRCCDVASEIAFLVMDMESRGGGELAREFLNRYLELTKDRELVELLPFYECYRAVVRGKVSALRSDADIRAASRYFDLANSYAWEEFKPFLVLICGLTGCGKSALAKALSRRLGLPVISSDATRKALAGISERRELSYGEGIYSPSMTEKTYAKMAEAAEQHILAGEGAILDATFQKAAHRSAILELARRRGARLALIHCHAPENLVRERLFKRAQEGTDLTDGRWEIYEQQKDSFEPIREFSPNAYLVLDTGSSPEKLAAKVERFLLSVLKKRA
jgi:aminoglycoside phosphotransferase family enzyme/predicted kinase